MTPSEPLYRLIPLTQGQWAIVDAADYNWLMQWKWRAKWDTRVHSFYAVRQVWLKGGKREHIQMHRFILGLQAGDKRQGNHRGHNTLDNRREKLRIVTRVESLWNRRIQANNSAGRKGVYTADDNRYRSQIWVDGKRKSLGSFPLTPAGLEAASERYQFAADLYFGEFACQDI